MSSSVEHAGTAVSPPPESAPLPDLTSAVRHVLASIEEPLTVSKIKAALPPSLRQTSLEDLNQLLRQEAAANRLHEYPKYRSQQERYWDRPMQVHIVHLLRSALEEKPLTWTELRRKLPAYAQDKAQEVLETQIQGKHFHRHPRQPGKRAGEPIGLRPADPRDYLQHELSDLFNRMEKLGFLNNQTRAAALEILHDEEWAPTPPEAKQNQNPDKASSGHLQPSSENVASSSPPVEAPSSSHQNASTHGETAATHSSP
jgi:hypothetical protein